MKKITILFIVAVMSMAAGCSGDDSAARINEPFDNSTLLGRWKLESWKIGAQQQVLTDCQALHDYFEFYNNYDANESFGEVINNRCTQQVYNHRYAINGDEFFIVEQNATVPYQAKFKITEATPTRLTVKLFWTSQETPSGGVQEDFIAEAEQPSYTYIKQ